jgi:hypothetical protein
VTALLAKYKRAISDPGVPRETSLESSGTLAGAGLEGTFHVWIAGADSRADQALGPRRETTLNLGDRSYLINSDGNVRELRGILLRRERTERFIESGDFASAPHRCTLRGTGLAGGQSVYLLDVRAEGGETQTVSLAAASGLPVRAIRSVPSRPTAITPSIKFNTPSGSSPTNLSIPAFSPCRPHAGSIWRRRKRYNSYRVRATCSYRSL